MHRCFSVCLVTYTGNPVILTETIPLHKYFVLYGLNLF